MIECPDCGAKNEAHYKFCLACGAEIGGGQGQIVDRPSAPSVRPTGPRARLPGLKERLQALRKGRPLSQESVDGSVSDASGQLPGWTEPPAGMAPIEHDSIASEPTKTEVSSNMQGPGLAEASTEETSSTPPEAVAEELEMQSPHEPLVEPAAGEKVAHTTSTDTEQAQSDEEVSVGSDSEHVLSESTMDAEIGSKPDTVDGDERSDQSIESMPESMSTEHQDAEPNDLEQTRTHDALVEDEVSETNNGAEDDIGSTGPSLDAQKEAVQRPSEESSVPQRDPILDSEGIELTRPAMDRDELLSGLQTAQAGDDPEPVGPDIDDRPTLVSPVLPDELFPCHQCGEPQPKEFKFCGACGARLEHGLAGVQVNFSDEKIPDIEIGQLVLIHPDGTEGERFSLGDGNLVIGRSHESPMFAGDQYLSPAHAQFRYQNGWMTIRDLDSCNGIFLKLQAEVPLVDGDLFRIGQQLLRFENLEPRFAGISPSQDGTHVLGSPRTGLWGKIVCVLDFDTSVEEWTLSTPEVYLGRERGTITFPDDLFVSGSHCRLRRQQNKTSLVDLGSTNGTYIRIKEETALASGDFILLGQQLFRLDLS